MRVSDIALLRRLADDEQRNPVDVISRALRAYAAKKGAHHGHDASDRLGRGA
jgi:hypothetical protein